MKKPTWCPGPPLDPRPYEATSTRWSQAQQGALLAHSTRLADMSPRWQTEAGSCPSLLAGDPLSVPTLQPELGRHVPREEAGPEAWLGKPGSILGFPWSPTPGTRDRPFPTSDFSASHQTGGPLRASPSRPLHPGLGSCSPRGNSCPSEAPPFLTLSKNKFGGPY